MFLDGLVLEQGDELGAPDCPFAHILFGKHHPLPLFPAQLQCQEHCSFGRAVSDQHHSFLPRQHRQKPTKCFPSACSSSPWLRLLSQARVSPLRWIMGASTAAGWIAPYLQTSTTHPHPSTFEICLVARNFRDHRQFRFVVLHFNKHDSNHSGYACISRLMPL